MSLKVTKFAGEYAKLAAWTGQLEAELRADEDYQAADRDHWLAWDGADVVGALHPWLAPDGRNRLYFDACRADAYVPLAGAISGGCYATINAGDESALTALAGAAFSVTRTELEYEIPVTRVDADADAGIRIVTADQTQLEPLMLLDCAIRADIPGADGWQPDPAWFRAETYDSPSFDPRTYCVALDGSHYIGLARVWKALPGQPLGRLGCVGVLAPYRRRGLGRALIARVFAALADAGQTAVTAEVDAENVASRTLLTGFGAQVIGSAVELHRAS